MVCAFRTASGGGFISDSDADSTFDVHNPTLAIIGKTADLIGNSLSVTAGYSHITVSVKSDATSGGLFGGATATNTGTVNPNSEAQIQGPAANITAFEGADLLAINQNYNVSQHSDGTCYCIGPSDGDNDHVNASQDARVTAAASSDLLVGPRVLPGPGVPIEDETPLAQAGHL